MAFWSNLMTRFVASYKAFNQPDLISDPLLLDAEFDTWASRRLRYTINWAYYENTAYSKIHKWATGYKTQYGLYKYIRNIYNPSYRLGEFWKSHLWGGMLDREAGDEGALPIETDNPALRLALADLWRWSNWQTKKDIVTLYGAALGDAVIKVIDDTEKGRVYLENIHPGKLKDVTFDSFGNVKSYEIEEQRANPTGGPQAVVFTEIVANQGGGTISHQTLLNSAPYDWTGNGPEWVTGYGFVPLVVIKHNDVGLDWGWSELQPGRSKINEVDDISSKLSDQIRKTVDAPWFFSGVPNPGSSPTTTETVLTGTAAQNRPQPGREELPALYATDPQAKAVALVAELDVGGALEHIKEILAEIERDYPELKLIADLQQASGDISGRALRIAQGPAADKVLQRRVSYDDALKRVQQMAVAIGGERGYFKGFNLASYEAGDLDHEIGERSVFAPDRLDELEVLEKEFTLGELPKLARWRLLGFDEKDKENGIPKLLEEAKQGLEMAQKEMAQVNNGDTNPVPNQRQQPAPNAPTPAA